MDKKICLFCKKKLKNDCNKRVHRSCWLKERDFEDRYLDFLFCNEKKNKQPTKSFVIKPTDEAIDPVDEMINELNDLVMDNKPPLYEYDKNITYTIDIAGNEILI